MASGECGDDDLTNTGEVVVNCIIFSQFTTH
jgi:hypothetical protein